MTLQEQLKQMALFDGWELIEAKNGMPEHYEKGNDWWGMDHPFDYDTNYNTLIPVWAKYRDMQIDLPEYYQYWDTVYDYVAIESIRSTFQALSDAITWYNSIKTA